MSCSLVVVGGCCLLCVVCWCALFEVRCSLVVVGCRLLSVSVVLVCGVFFFRSGSLLVVGPCWLSLYIVRCLSSVACYLSFYVLILCVVVCISLCVVRCVLFVVD